MVAKCTLSLNEQNTELNLSEVDPSEISSVAFSKSFDADKTVYEDGNYEIHFECDEYKNADISSVDMYVNGEYMGHAKPGKSKDDIVKVDIEYKVDKEDKRIKHPFLLHNGYVIISFNLSFTDDSSKEKEYFSDFLLCASKNKKDEENIKNMLKELIKFSTTQVGEWLFSNAEHDKNSLLRGKWTKNAYKSPETYIQLLFRVIEFYENNYAYFKMQGKHTIKRAGMLVSYEKVKTISQSSFNWIMQNTDQLAISPNSQGIRYQGKNYLPYKIRVDSNKKSWDVYENRVLVSFLNTVLSHAKKIRDELEKEISDEKAIFSKINPILREEYIVSIITIKGYQKKRQKYLYNQLSEKLNRCINLLQHICKQYMSLFDVPLSLLTEPPRKTSTFCEIKPYAQAFELILLWFQYGEYSLEEEDLILKIKTLDKLFEYYCLMKFLQLLTNKGFEMETKDKFFYNTAGELFKNEKDVANTYILCNDDGIRVTLYYQPVISANDFENDLKLYRTTNLRLGAGKNDYYAPDFILKFSSVEHDEEYAIIDAKFSYRKKIEDEYLPDVIRKYSCEFAVAANNRAPKMVWILQGRVDSKDDAIWRYHNSPLAEEYPPITSYGIVSINTALDNTEDLWNEIKNNISILK